MGSNNPYLLDVKPFFVLFPFFSPFLLSNLGKCPSRPFFHSSLLLLLPLEKAAQELCLCQMWQHFITSLLSGLGAGLFFFRRPVFLNTTAEASPFTNVTIDTTNTNNPQITQSQTATQTLTNTNTDQDTNTSDSDNTIT